MFCWMAIIKTVSSSSVRGHFLINYTAPSVKLQVIIIYNLQDSDDGRYSDSEYKRRLNSIDSIVELFISVNSTLKKDCNHFAIQKFL